MNTIRKGCLGIGLGIVTMLSLQWAQTPLADDTEIYQAEASPASTGRPKVLIVFDDSGSMSFEVDQQRPRYRSDGEYVNRFGTDRIYWSSNGSVPGTGSDNWFPASTNRCASSYSNLQNNGLFQTTAARRWVGSQIVQGECSLECPDGTTYRRGDEGRACYEYVTYTVSEEVCTDNWREVYRNDKKKPDKDDPGYEEWESYDKDFRRDYKQGKGKNKVFIYEVNDPSCENVSRQVTDWRYVQERVQICEENSVIPGTWQALDNNVNDPPHVDCRNDVDTLNSGNGIIGSGYPQNNVATGSEYGANPDSSSALWGNTPYTFYTSHYLDWYHDDSLVEPRTRLDIAQEVVTSLIRSNPGIDFGLEEFNYDQGGRIVQHIIENMSEDQRSNLIDMVNRIDHAGSTPICESMYEAYRYISGDGVVYGTQAQSGSDSRGVWDVLARDPDADNDGVYNSPNTDCAYTYVILMTDGEPQRDTDANSRIKNLPNVSSCSNYRDADGNMTENCLPELAEYMATTDLDNDTTNGNQYAITYTIGFTTNQELLADAAERGKGEYYTANNAQELTEAFQGAIYSILSTDTTFTSPAVAVDTFTRTQSRDEVFYAMFKPTERVNWPGNIKKLKVSQTDDGAVLVDANGDPAIDPTTGFIKETAVTFWSSGEDGGNVELGGVSARLSLRNPSTRNVLINTAANGALESFSANNLSPGDFGLETNAGLYALFGASTEAAFLREIDWGLGYDAYDSDGDDVTDEARRLILGDILHSQPLVINYGATSGFSRDNPDLRIVVGTNAGFIHMFGNSDGDEDWAFLPKDLVGNLSRRRQNALSSDNIYGIDTTAVVYQLDNDGDGTIEPNDGDKVYLYIGMRRGGRALYALDVSTPGSPSLMWSLSPASAGFAEMGQTWSSPVPSFIPGYRDAQGKPKPVIIFGAGYDDRKDATGLATPDSMGRGVFIVDAATGALVWSVTPNANSANNMQETSLQHSIAAGVTVIDGNGDGLSDRIYMGDTGGNLWRVDMPGNSLPDSAQDSWYIVKMARFNGLSAATDRRIFNAPDVVRTRFNNQAVDAVIVATGDRTNPNATDVSNRVYMIRDEAVVAYSTPEPGADECGDEDFEGDFRCLLPLTDSRFYDITSNALAEQTEAQVLQALIGVNGWRMDLAGTGEKGLAKTLTLNGKIFVPTFTPNDLLNDISICEPLAGSGKLYIIDLLNGDRSLLNLAPVIPDTPSVFFGEDGRVSLLLPPGTPTQENVGDVECVGGVCDIGQLFRQPYGNYWMQEQY